MDVVILVSISDGHLRLKAGFFTFLPQEGNG